MTGVQTCALPISAQAVRADGDARLAVDAVGPDVHAHPGRHPGPGDRVHQPGEVVELEVGKYARSNRQARNLLGEHPHRPPEPGLTRREAHNHKVHSINHAERRLSQQLTFETGLKEGHVGEPGVPLRSPSRRRGRLRG